ncbi:ATP-binding protein [Lachnospiraceae bacterium LCP25S3_G4]
MIDHKDTESATFVLQKQCEEYEKRLQRYRKAIYSIYDEVLELDYKNKTFKNDVSEKSMFNPKKILLPLEEAIDTWTNQKVCSEDRNLVIQFLSHHSQSGKENEYPNEPAIEYRVVQADGIKRWCRMLSLQLEEYTFLYCNKEITLEKEEEQIKQEKEHKEYLYNTVPAGLIFYYYEKQYPVYMINEDALNHLGFESQEDYMKWTGGYVESSIYPEDRGYVKLAIEQQLMNCNVYNITYRFYKKNGQYIWVNEQGKMIVEKCTQKKMVACALIDASKEHDLQVQIALYRATQKGGVFTIYMDDEFTIIYGNDIYYNMHELAPEDMKKMFMNKAINYIHPEDRRRVKEVIAQAYQRGRKICEWDMRIITGRGNQKHVLVSGAFARINGRQVLNGTVIDITKQKKIEVQLKESKLKYEVAMQNSNIRVWEYNILEDKLYQEHHDRGKKKVISNYAKQMLAKGKIREESIPEFQRIYQELRSRKKQVSGDIWIKSRDGNGWRCKRAFYTTIFDSNGIPIKAFGAESDVTREKEAEKKYYDELAYREAVQSAIVGSTKLNLTKNLVLEGHSKYATVLATIQNESADTYFEHVAQTIKDKVQANHFREVFTCEKLLSEFEIGHDSIHQEMKRELEPDSFYWLDYVIHMVKEPDTNEVIAFIYSTDITNEKVAKGIMDSIAKTDYDFIVLVNGCKNTAIRYSVNTAEDCAYSERCLNFEEETEQFMRLYCIAENVEHCIEQAKLANIMEQLDKSGIYSIFYTRRMSNGELRKKQLQFSYVSREHREILLKRIDVTNVLMEEERKNEELQEALYLAKQANIAKSDFLARMSHEIRTPMNAIMGMEEIMSTNLSDINLVSDCVEKSKIASKYLLSLINDILDMSKIENGRIKLLNEHIVFDKFMEGINTIIENQANVNGVSYQIQYKSKVRRYYVGDTIRLQQVLLNILNNAIKFTPQGGKVRLSIEELSSKNGKAQMRFSIADTGIGISQEFIPKLFQPFSQEHSSTTSKYEGSGLGLAISKNLARLMDGDIRVESFVGVGTTFIIDIWLDILEGHYIIPSEHQLKDKDYNLEGKRILLVEDHPLNALVAMKLLKQKGCDICHAENGQICVEVFASSQIGEFDAILMDIRMPILDGLEATKVIRSFNRIDALTIPIIAMTANAFEDDKEKSKEVGMNEHLSKPIEPQKLYRVLAEHMR